MIHSDMVLVEICLINFYPAAWNADAV